jgi:hypothetical protein
MVLDVLVHFSLEAIGALGVRCTLALCRHARHRVAAWTSLGLLTSWLIEPSRVLRRRKAHDCAQHPVEPSVPVRHHEVEAVPT